MAELLATGKLTELACLTLYLAYEKKRGKDSCWYHYIRELDRCGCIGASRPCIYMKHTLAGWQACRALWWQCLSAAASG